MKIKLLAVVSIFNFLICSTYAELKVFNLKDKRVSIDAPKGWQTAEYMFGSPISLLGPFKNGRRPVVTFNPTTIENYSFDSKELKNSEKSYQTGRIAWLEKNHGKLIRFLDYKASKWLNIPEVHFIGYQYEMLGENFRELSYFFNCQNEVVNYHVLATDEQYASYSKEIEQILNSTNCLK